MNFRELMQRMEELDQPTNERAVGGQPGINRLTGKPMAPAAAEPDHLAEPPERAPADPGAPNLLANKTRMPDPAAAAKAQRASSANDLANQQQPKEGNAFSGALDTARDAGKSEFEVDGQTFKVKEDDVDECGMPGMSNMPGGMMGMRTPPQQDSVSMNLSMNGAGANGIRDLMDILRNLDGDEDSEMDIDMPDMGNDMPIVMKALSGDQGDSANDEEERMPLGDEMYQGIDAVTQGGADLNKPKQTFPKVAGGDNPMQPMAERIAQQLKGLYEEIKNR